jgi:hypothetical protein
MNTDKVKGKYLYSFEASNSEGVAKKFCILKPSRKMKEDGELYYASKLSQFISAGVLPKIVWDKVYKDNGGTLSHFMGLLERAVVKPEASRTDDESFEIDRINGEIQLIKKQMQEMEMAQVNAFENTAEAKARNRSIVWWAINLAGTENLSGDFDTILKGDSIDDKLDHYDDIIEDDKFLAESFSRINYLITLWYLGGVVSFEDFKSLDEEYIKKNQKDAEDAKLLKEVQQDFAPETVAEVADPTESVASV